MNKYIIPSEGNWNTPTIDSDSLGMYNGYKPLYEGGCFAIIPNGNTFIIFAFNISDNFFSHFHYAKFGN
jgi:hypothetical protein